MSFTFTSNYKLMVPMFVGLHRLSGKTYKSIAKSIRYPPDTVKSYLQGYLDEPTIGLIRALADYFGLRLEFSLTPSEVPSDSLKSKVAQAVEDILNGKIECPEAIEHLNAFLDGVEQTVRDIEDEKRDKSKLATKKKKSSGASVDGKPATDKVTEFNRSRKAKKKQ